MFVCYCFKPKSESSEVSIAVTQIWELLITFAALLKWHWPEFLLYVQGFHSRRTDVWHNERLTAGLQYNEIKAQTSQVEPMCACQTAR